MALASPLFSLIYHPNRKGTSINRDRKPFGCLCGLLRYDDTSHYRVARRYLTPANTVQMRRDYYRELRRNCGQPSTYLYAPCTHVYRKAFTSMHYLAKHYTIQGDYDIKLSPTCLRPPSLTDGTYEDEEDSIPMEMVHACFWAPLKWRYQRIYLAMDPSNL
jgi:hypothetical protein